MICLCLFFFVFFIFIVVITEKAHGFLPFFICFLCSIFSIFDHFNDLANIRMGNEYIEIKREAIRELDIEMKNLSLSIPNTSLLNADSPYRSLIELKGERIKQLTDSKKALLDYKKSLEQRKMGLNRDVVWLFGDK